MRPVEPGGARRGAVSRGDRTAPRLLARDRGHHPGLVGPGSPVAWVPLGTGRVASGSVPGVSVLPAARRTAAVQPVVGHAGEGTGRRPMDPIRRVGPPVAGVAGDTGGATSPAQRVLPMGLPALPPGCSTEPPPCDRAARVRYRRALMLMVMTLVVPGSAQLVAGNRRVGRLATRLWAALLVRGLRRRGAGGVPPPVRVLVRLRHHRARRRTARADAARDRLGGAVRRRVADRPAAVALARRTGGPWSG